MLFRGAGVTTTAPDKVPIGVMHSRVSNPLTFDSHLPQMPSWHPRRGLTCSAISRIAFSAAIVGSVKIEYSTSSTVRTVRIGGSP